MTPVLVYAVVVDQSSGGNAAFSMQAFGVQCEFDSDLFCRSARQHPQRLFELVAKLCIELSSIIFSSHTPLQDVVASRLLLAAQ